MKTFFSPAKVNLFLKVVNRRPDGYHNIASLFQTIDLFDELSIALDSQDSLTVSDPSIPCDETNLVLKAVNLFRRKTGLKFGVKANLNKQIPVQAGLGGGSGNAATTLWALNELCHFPATISQLADWSAEIGSDISFFFSQGTAYCTGRGEKVNNLPHPPSKTVWVIKPPQGLSTPEVYRNLNVSHLSSIHPEKDLNAFLDGKAPYFNDLETSAFRLMPALGELKQDLIARGFQTVLMTGSGSAFFCLGSGTPPKDKTLFCREVKFLNRHPDKWYNETIHHRATENSEKQ